MNRPRSANSIPEYKFLNSLPEIHQARLLRYACATLPVTHMFTLYTSAFFVLFPEFTQPYTISTKEGPFFFFCNFCNHKAAYHLPSLLMILFLYRIQKRQENKSRSGMTYIDLTCQCESCYSYAPEGYRFDIHQSA